MLRGIDVSSNDGWPFNANTERAFRESDFVIVKATQGITYVNPYKIVAAKRVLDSGKLLGFYHYAGGNSPREEAEFFWSKISEHMPALMALDWEDYQNRSWGDTSWCRKFADRFHELSGIWPAIYIQSSELRQAENCADDCALWVADYPDDRNSWIFPSWDVSTGKWDRWTLWQYTSSGGKTDREFFDGDSPAWNAIAGGAQPEPDDDGKDDGRMEREWWRPIVVASGERGELVGLVQRTLNDRGFDCGTADGIFGKNTEAAVMSFQREHGLDDDGIVGPDTAHELFA